MGSVTRQGQEWEEGHAKIRYPATHPQPAEDDTRGTTQFLQPEIAVR